jgi:threonine/homoserine/homoserine lactone efflux protein
MEFSLFLGFLLLLGIGFGIISSTPLGPINLLVAENYLSKPKIKILPFLAGVILIDSIFGYITYLGFDRFLKDSPEIGTGVGIFGGLAIILLGAIGAYQLLSPKKENEQSKIKIKKSIFLTSSSASFGKGFILCGSNPGFIAFWSWVAFNAKGWTTSLFPNYEIDNLNLILFSIGIVVGDFIWFGFFIYLLKKGAEKYSVNIIKKIRLFISIGLILLGCYTLFSSLL